MNIFDKKTKSEEEIKSSEGLNVLDVDLIKDQDEKSLNWAKYIGLIVLSFIISAALSLEIYWLIGWWEGQEGQKSQKTEEEINQVKEEIEKLSNDYQEFTEFKIKTDIVKELIKTQAHWTNFFNWLERKTLSSVTWQSFSGDLSGIYNLDGQASTFADISWQTRAFLQDDWVRLVSVDSGSGGITEKTVEIEGRFDNDGSVMTQTVLTSDVSFNLQLEINPVLFYHQ
jgi:hypothetical protein